MTRTLPIALAALAIACAAPLAAAADPTLDAITPAVSAGTFQQITSGVVETERGKRLFERERGAAHLADDPFVTPTRTMRPRSRVILAANSIG